MKKNIKEKAVDNLKELKNRVSELEKMNEIAQKKINSLQEQIDILRRSFRQ